MLLRALPWLLTPALFAAPAVDAPKLQLPGGAAPTHYAIDLTIIPGQDKFQGVAEIEITFGQSTKFLWLNGTDLAVKQAVLKTGTQSLPATVVPGGSDFIGFSFPQAAAGKAVLHVEYEGKISRNSSAGLFQLRDGDPWYVYSQFEPTDARRAFPCFDEPAFKVPWELMLHVKKDQMALANTPIVSEVNEANGMKRFQFAQTKPLPSYLVALAVGPFEAVDLGKHGKNHTPLRVIVTKGRGAEAAWAKESIPPLLERLEDYFGMPYPYEKLDSISMPISNFAMENVGLITYGQSILLGNPEHDTIRRKRDFAITAAHEMAHQWFGDLVTTAWWNDIWLNEAFASWMENKIVEKWKPEWSVDIEAMRSRLGAMQLDSLVASRKIRQPIESNDDIANAFDGITYNKGEAVIETFERYVGAEKFRDGVREYMKTYANRNATAEQFLKSISTAAGRDVAPAFNSFLDQAGVPLVTVELQCANGSSSLRLSQRRSLPIGSKGAGKENWLIPVCAKYEADGQVRTTCELMTDPTSNMKLAAKSCPAWVLANDGEAGYYRVLYKGDLLDRLLKDNGHLTVAERVGILGDVIALVNSGDLQPAAALSLVSRYRDDPNREIVASVVNIAGLVRGPGVASDLRPNGQRFIEKMFGDRARKLGWKSQPGESYDTRLLRQELVGFVAGAGEDKILSAEAGRLARAWLKDRSAIDSDLVSTVLHVAARDGDRALFDQFHAAAKNEKDRRARRALIGSLGLFRDPGIANSALALTLTGEFDAREGFAALLFGPEAYPETRRLPFEFVKKNIDAILSKLPREVGGDFAAELPGSGNSFCDASSRAELADFFGGRVKDYTGGPRQLAQTLEGIDLCIARKQAVGPGIAAFLKQY